MLKRICSGLLSLMIILGIMVGCFAVPTMAENPDTSESSAASENSDVYWRVVDNVLHLGYFSYAGDNSDLVPTSITSDTQPWKAQKTTITSVIIDSDIYPTSTAYWFYCLENCVSMNLTRLHTDNVTNMGNMFGTCKTLTSLNVSNFNTENVTNMSYMFISCESLTSLDLSSFNTAKVTNMYFMFGQSQSLQALNLSSFNTSNVINMNNMFYGCESLTSLNLSNFNTTKVTDMGSMFGYCRSLVTLNISSFDTSKVTNMRWMFKSCGTLTDLNLSSFNTTKVTNMSYMFADCSSLISLDLSGFDTINVTNMSDMFSGCEKLTSLNVSNFNTSNVTDMSYMFYNCSLLPSLNINNFNTAKTTNMSDMFSGCEKLTSLNLSSFNTSNVINMNNMFYGCESLTSLNINNFNTAKTTNMSSMFSGCKKLTSLDLSSFNTAKVKRMSSMFYDCKALTSLDLSNFNTSNVIEMPQMFAGCSSLTELNLSSFDTSNVTNIKNMFSNCISLTTLITQNTGINTIELPFDMIEKNSPDSKIYSKMPSGNKTLVPYALSFLEEATDTMLHYNLTVNGESIALDIYNFGVYKENGTLVTTVQNDSNGNILVETKDLPIGKYYVQEIKGSNINIQYDLIKNYFTIEEKTIQTSEITTSTTNNYVASLETDIFTNSENSIIASGYDITVSNNDTVLYTGHAYCADRKKSRTQGKMRQIYVNPTLDEINIARGEVYTGSQTDLADAIRCILYFNKDIAQDRLWDLLNYGAIIDTSKKNEIPDWFSWAIITPPDWSMQPLIVPLAISKDLVTTQDVLTGNFKIRSLKKINENTINNISTAVVNIDKKSNFDTSVVGATLAVYDANDNKIEEWVTGESLHSLTLLAGTYTLKELEAPADYKKANDIEFVVTTNNKVLVNDIEQPNNTIIMTDKMDVPETGVKAVCIAFITMIMLGIGFTTPYVIKRKKHN